ncbi:PHD and RING finger domain-containing protein 1 [Aplysia californica]|uniref:PHD and RING finger domain-containing protein 1 n=1 Tax=Aplysia californica TaxID=6500 RepID=A0ABM0JLT4_APLCA|nr:PHD and RING finger domain-containing protein 1 [Aplysia californica]
MIEESESDGEDGDVCPICLNKFRLQDIGTPESCDHSFCLECIQEWAKNVNTCPVDRQVFHLILARHVGEEIIFKQIPVENRSQAEEEQEEDDPTYCEVCGQADREDRLLLCDGCDMGYHCECLDPPLAQVPVDEWFCPDCQQARDQANLLMPRQLRRQIARTRVSERVRRIIADIRIERAQRQERVAAAMDAQDEGEGDNEPGPSTSSSTTRAAAPRRRKTTRKRTTRKKTRRKTTRKRKTTKKKTAGSKTGTKRKRKTTRKGKGRKKRKVKKTTRRSSATGSSPAAVRTARIPPVTSVKGRIADKLGLSRPPAGRSIPLQKTSSGASRVEPGGAGRFSDFKMSSFSILGRKDELYCFAEHEGEERQPVNRPAIPAKALLSRSALSSHKPLSFAPTKRKIVVPQPPVAQSSSSATTSSPSAAPAASASCFDLLGSIMQNQDLLAKGSKHVIIKRDGSLHAAGSKSSSQSNSSPSSSAQSSGVEARSDSSLQVKQSPIKKSSSASEVTAKSDKTISWEIRDKKRTARVKSSTSSKSVETEASFSKSADSDEELATMAMGGTEGMMDTSGDEMVEEKRGGASRGASETMAEGFLDSLVSSSAQRTSDDGCDLSETGPSSSAVFCDDGSADRLGGQNLSSVPDGDSEERHGARNTQNEQVDDFSEEPSTSQGLSNSGPSSSALSSGPSSSAQSLAPSLSALDAMSSVEGHGRVSRMKRNLDYLVSSKGNLAGFESGEDEETGSIDTGEVGFRYEREEGEASDSGEEGEVRSVGEAVEEEGDGGDQEEGEIVDDEEEWAPPAGGCAEEEEEGGGGGLDVNAIHIEEMERGTFRKRSESQGEVQLGGGGGDAGEMGKTQEDKFDKDSPVVKEEEGAVTDEEERDGRVNGSMMGSLVTHNFDEKKEKTLKKEEEEEAKRKVEEEERNRQEAEEDKSKKKISILDFLGPAGPKFGVEGEGSTSVVSRGGGRGRGRGFHYGGRGGRGGRGTTGFGGEEYFENGREEEGGGRFYRGRGRGRWYPGSSEQGFRFGSGRKRKGYDGEEEEEEDGGSEFFGRRDGRWQKDDEWSGEPSWQHGEKHSRKYRKFQPNGEKRRRRSDSQDSRPVSQRSGSYDSSSSRPRRRDSEKDERRRGNRGKRRRSRSRSRSEERKRGRRYEGDRHQSREEKRRRRGKWSRTRRDREEEEDSSSSSGEEGSGNGNVSSGMSGDEGAEERERMEEVSTNGYAYNRDHDLPASSTSAADNLEKVNERQPWPGHPPPIQGAPAEIHAHHPSVHIHGGRQQPPAPFTQHPDGPPPPPPLHTYQGHVQPPPRPPHGQAYPSAPLPTQPLQHHLPPHPTARPPAHPGAISYPQSSYPPPHYSGPPHPHNPATAPGSRPMTRPHSYPYPGYPTYPPAPRPMNPMHNATLPPPVPPPGHPTTHPTSTPHNAGFPPHYGHTPPSQPPTASTTAAHPHMSQHPPYYPGPPSGHYPPPAPATTRHPMYPTAPAVGSTYPSHPPTSQHQPPPQQPPAPAAHPGYPRYPQPVTGVEKVEPGVTLKQEVGGGGKLEPGTAGKVESHPALRHEAGKTRLKSPKQEKVSRRASYRISPPPAIRGVATSDRLASNILHDEVKKGFKQLVEDAVRSALKAAWSNKKISKEEYKDIFKRSVEKVTASKETVVHQEKIRSLVDAYVMKARKARRS